MRKVGTEQNPINIFDDQEDHIDIETKLEIARNKELIEEAKLFGSSLDLCFAVIKTTISGQMITKERRLTKSILKYFKEKIDINISCEHFYPRLQADYAQQETKINPCELILYGVDFLTTNAIKDRFKILDSVIRQIFWINDSTCKIKYSSKEQTAKVVKDQTTQIKIQDDDDSLPKGWLSIKPYTIFSFERELFIRYSTDQENHIPKQSTRKYQEFYQAQALLANHLLNEFKAMDKFIGVVRQIERDTQLIRRHRNSDSRNRSREDQRKGDRYRNRDSNNRNSYNAPNEDPLRRNRHQNQDNSYPHQRNRGREGERERGFNSGGRERQEQRRSYEPEMVPCRQIHRERYQQMPVYRMRNNQANNASNRRSMIHYDSCEIDSNYSFNNVGSIRGNPNKDKEVNLDFDFNRSDYEYNHENSRGKESYNFEINLSKEPSQKKQADTSFHYVNVSQSVSKTGERQNYDYVLNQSVLKGVSGVNEEQFFDINESGISEVQQKRVQQMDISFNLQKEMTIQKNEHLNKPKAVVDNLDFNQDSY